MKGKTLLKLRRAMAYLAFFVVILYIITGFGITEYQFMEKITFGVLTKSFSFKMHDYLIWPLMITLGLHIYYSALLKQAKKQ